MKRGLAFIVSLIFFIPLLSGCFERREENPGTDLPYNHLYGSLRKLTIDDMKLLKDIRESIFGNKNLSVYYLKNLSFSFDRNFSWVFITLYENGIERRAYSLNDSLQDSLKACISDIRENLSGFDENSIMIFEIITTQPQIIDMRNASGETLDLSRRFEIGVDGLMVENGTLFFLPTDAYTKSILNINSLKSYLKIVYNITEDLTFYKFRTKSILLYSDMAIPLYRGYPIEERYNLYDLRDVVLRSAGWLVNHQMEDGRFIYYVDSITGYIDLEDYNIVRHCGTLIFLLDLYKETGNRSYIYAINSGIRFILNHLQVRFIDGKPIALYVFYDNTSKLGADGLALSLLSRYQRYTGNDTFYPISEGLARHIIAQIKEDGEFEYYYIHPMKEGINESYFFNTYYPGEALIGLADFYSICRNRNLMEDIHEKSKKALDFLVYEMYDKYSYMMEELPTTSWIMGAILEWLKIGSFENERDYEDFVFREARKMIEHQYNFNNSLYPDYLGGYYYDYGDHVYPDASRSEGLMYAYRLAKLKNKKDLEDEIMEAMELAAINEMHLTNTIYSSYCYKNPSLSIGGIRFKLTRHWFRIDTITHVANFYLQLLKEKGIGIT